MTYRFRIAAAVAAALCALVLRPAPASAFVAPLTDIDGTWFPTRSDDIRMLYVTARAEQLPASSDGARAARWQVEAEMVLRNHGPDARTVSAAVLADPDAASVRAWIDGVPVDGEAIVMRQDPAMPDVASTPALRLETTVDSEAIVVLRVRFDVVATYDTVGQQFFDLPTHALGLWDDVIADGHLEMRFQERPLALTSTLVGGTVYDEPENIATWNLHQWEPRVPFRAAQLSPWTALLVVATVEECPDPYRVLQWMSASRLSELDTYLNQFDGDTLGFCANLPLVLHGWSFPSDRARNELSAIPFERYLPDTGRGPLYVENTAFAEEELSEVEMIYRRTLGARVFDE